jgi:hypothetical protein
LINAVVYSGKSNIKFEYLDEFEGKIQNGFRLWNRGSAGLMKNKNRGRNLVLNIKMRGNLSERAKKT